GKVAQQQAEAKRLTRLLAEAQKKAAMVKGPLVVFDVRGVLYLQRLALEEAARASLKEAGEPSPMLALLDQELSLAERFAGKKTERGALEEVGRGAVQALGVARVALKELPPAEWQPRHDRGMKLAERAREAKVVRPGLYVDVARYLDREAALAEKRGEA